MRRGAILSQQRSCQPGSALFRMVLAYTRHVSVIVELDFLLDGAFYRV